MQNHNQFLKHFYFLNVMIMFLLRKILQSHQTNANFSQKLVKNIHVSIILHWGCYRWVRENTSKLQTWKMYVSLVLDAYNALLDALLMKSVAVMSLINLCNLKFVFMFNFLFFHTICITIVSSLLLGDINSQHFFTILGLHHIWKSMISIAYFVITKILSLLFSKYLINFF